MKRRTVLMCILLCIALFIPGCGCGKKNVVVEKEMKRRHSTGDSWTVMIYMSASGLEKDYKRAGEVLKNMAYDLPENINVIIETGACKAWSIDGVDADKTQDFIVQKNGIRKIYESDKANMGSAKTYSKFLARSIDAYPAEKYISVIWGDGGGPIGGVAHDITNGNDSLTPNELKEALESVDTKLDIIAFDANMSASLEIASAVAPYADYMVASEDIMPITGLDYNGLIEYISENPSSSAAQVSQVICDGVKDIASGDGKKFMAISAIDLTHAQILATAFDAFAEKMAENSENIANLQKMTALMNNAHFLGANTDWEGYSNLVDLKSLENQLAPVISDGQSDIERAISKAVFYKVTGEINEDVGGISLYYPKNKSIEEINKYKDIYTGKGYIDYIEKTFAHDGILNRISDYKETSSYKEYQSVIGGYTITAEADHSGIYYMSASNSDIITKIGVNLYSYNEEDGIYYYLNTDNNVYYNKITDIYEYKLSNTHLKLNKISVSVYLVNDLGSKKVYSVPVTYKDKSASVRLLATENNGEWEYTVLGVWNGLDEKTGIADRNYQKIEVGDTITPMYEIYKGIDGEYIKGKDLTIVFGGLNVSERAISDGEYIISFETEDVYGKQTESKPTNATAIKGKLQILK